MPIFILLAVYRATSTIILATGLPSYTLVGVTVCATNIFGRHYCYTTHFMELSASSSPTSHCVWLTYQSPIKQLAPFIARHPDRALASYMPAGFKIRYSYDRACLRSCNINTHQPFKTKQTESRQSLRWAGCWVQ